MRATVAKSAEGPRVVMTLADWASLPQSVFRSIVNDIGEGAWAREAGGSMRALLLLCVGETPREPAGERWKVGRLERDLEFTLARNSAERKSTTRGLLGAGWAEGPGVGALVLA